MEFYFTLCVIVSRIWYVYSYGSGAPASACINLTPGHSGSSGQSSAIPYTVSLSKPTYAENGQITVTVTGNGGHQGLLVQARKNDGSTTPVGTFSQPSGNTKTTGCTQTADSWTHSNTASKQTSTAVWTAPSNNVGQIVFKATVAASRNVYWLNIQSSVVEFSSPTTTPAATTPSTTPPAATTPAATDPQATTSAQDATSNQAGTTNGATNSVQSTSDTNTNDDGNGNTNDDRNGHGKNYASCLFTLVAMVTSILLINKY